MTKDYWMYAAILGLAAAAYLYFDEQSILGELAKKNVTGLSDGLQKRVEKKKGK